ncbi:PEP-CTERM sorting domain-containing protein [Marinobacter sp. 71-i]|uniref:PEP-CTERM sorting domain-containing protein n=1 Tax=Marinobacter iranensis TaxID=2962607 RepID=A0ABT5Y8E5_9GAMM|nr:PEP-CTERM sorting domain-containing protein [Marinobacter iranensis]MDF0749918.1 PEP-CTERM sorting domain-containing protein [Marinobacter iranensis]
MLLASRSKEYSPGVRMMNTRTKLWSLMIATLSSGLMLSGTAMAAPIICSDPTINHMSMDDSQASACLDSGLGNIQGDNAVQDPFLSGVGTDYQFIEKSEGASNPTTMYSLEYAGSNGTGTWEFDSSLWGDFGTIALGFKFGGGNQPDNWFVYELVPGVSSGNWAFNLPLDGGDGLSHMNLYGKNSVQVPEPGTLALLGLGIIGLTLARRKNRTS